MGEERENQTKKKRIKQRSKRKAGKREEEKKEKEKGIRLVESTLNCLLVLGFVYVLFLSLINSRV